MNALGRTPKQEVRSRKLGIGKARAQGSVHPEAAGGAKRRPGPAGTLRGHLRAHCRAKEATTQSKAQDNTAQKRRGNTHKDKHNAATHTANASARPARHTRTQQQQHTTPQHAVNGSGCVPSTQSTAQGSTPPRSSAQSRHAEGVSTAQQGRHAAHNPPRGADTQEARPHSRSRCPGELKRYAGKGPRC